MDKLGIIRSFILMNSGKFFTEVKEDEDVMLAFCGDNSEIWWNFAFLKKPVGKERLQSIADFFEKRKRAPTIYFPDEGFYDDVLGALRGGGFKASSQDCWMFWEGESPYLDESNIFEVKSDEDFEKWVETFLRSYPKDDPKNPYGEQVEFSKVIDKAWKRGMLKNDCCFLAFDNNKPAAVGMLTSYQGKGYISAIGSVPEVRGRGFGKRMSLFCVRESFRRGNEFHFLATEKEHFPFNFYKKIGFSPKFTATYYTKSN